MSRRKERSGRKKGQDYWQSYSDMMAALLLIFVLLIAGSIYQLNQQRVEALRQQQKYEGLLGDLEDAKAQLDRILGVKRELVQALNDEFQSAGLTVNIDEGTGDITFEDNILFGYKEYNLSKAGKSQLEEFVPVYISVLLSPENLKNISEIVIEGHTDTKGGYDYNLKLSQDRALSVAKYCMDIVEKNGGKKDLKHLRTIMTANGRSESDPVYDKKGNIDMDASRRVVFKFRLKDEAMIEEMSKILN